MMMIITMIITIITILLLLLLLLLLLNKREWHGGLSSIRLGGSIVVSVLRGRSELRCESYVVSYAAAE